MCHIKIQRHPKSKQTSFFQKFTSSINNQPTDRQLVAVMEVVTRGEKEGLPWELLYADDLVLVAQSKEELREKVL